MYFPVSYQRLFYNKNPEERYGTSWNRDFIIILHKFNGPPSSYFQILFIHLFIVLKPLDSSKYYSAFSCNHLKNLFYQSASMFKNSFNLVAIYFWIVMSFVKEVSSWILQGINSIIQDTRDEQVEGMIQHILQAKSKKVLVLGSGRSGFVGRAFALRLMQSGFSVYVSGETIAPALSPGDLILAISGSGTTKVVVTQAEIAKEMGAKVISLTSHRDSRLGQLSDHVVVIKGRTKEAVDIDFVRRQITGEYDMAPLGTMFELSALVFLDGVIADIMKRLGQNEIDLKRRHAHTQ